MSSVEEPRDDTSRFENEPDAPSRPPSIFRKRDDDEPAETRGPFLQADSEEDEPDDSIAALKKAAATMQAEPSNAAPDEPADDSILPRQPRSLAEVGLSRAFLADLTLKIMHYTGTPSAGQLMRRLGLGQAMVQQILTTLQEERLCEALSQSDLFTGNYRYRLSERGVARAMEALERTRYAGPVPVTAEQYAEVMRAQQGRRKGLSPERIRAVLAGMVLAPDVADSVARALYSGKPTIFYGQSGNGKSSVVENFARSQEGVVLIPYAIYAYGQVIRVFDPSMHEPAEELDDRNSTRDDKLDRRWVLVRRPTVIIGSEAGPESLDLTYDPQARFYQAPPHVKAQGGVLIADNLGGQKIDSNDLMTRWLIGAERGWDSLSLITGEKLTVPFDVQLLFGTNRPVNELADEAVLRRVLYKVEIPSPGPVEFAELLRQLCQQKNVRAAEGAIERVIDKLYNGSGERPRAAYARDLVEVIIESAEFDGREPVLDEESFQKAFHLFLAERSGNGS